MPDQATILPGTKAAKILADNGLQVTEKQAENIVQFLTILAKTTFANEKRISLYQGEHRRAS